jgi:spore coat polysaccharide biosynthesis protein SpsF
MRLDGRTVLARVVERVSRARGLDAVIVATTTRGDDDATAEEAARAGAVVFRGSELDVLARYVGAARRSGAAGIVRVTADSPLFDPHVLSAMLVRWKDSRASGAPPDYLSNCRPRTFPRGLDAEIFTTQALLAADAGTRSAYEREHVTTHIVESRRFRLDNYSAPADNSRHRWTLDTPDDWAFMEAVHDAFASDQSSLATEELLALLERRPDIVALNAHVGETSGRSSTRSASINRAR